MVRLVPCCYLRRTAFLSLGRLRAFALVARLVLLSSPERLPDSLFLAGFVSRVAFAIYPFRFLVLVDLSPAPGGVGW